jgi:dipeptidyl aminopeptidase/acylaminoacyl peptidase
VAAVWSATGLDDEALESVPASGGPATIWLNPSDQALYFLAGWSSHFGIVLWLDNGGGGPSTENYGLPLGIISEPKAPIMELGTVPVFQQPATAIGVNRLAIVVNGTASSGQGEGEKFAWFGKTVELCGSAPACSPVSAPSSSVTDDPTISPVDGSMAFIEAPKSQVDLPPLYSSAATWPQIVRWYASDALWILPVGSDSPVQVGNTAGAVDPVFSEKGSRLVFVEDQALWLLPGLSSQPVEIARPLQRPPSPYLFGYMDWPDEFAWWG